MREILARIVELRMARGWSEYFLAEQSGLPQSTISSWYRKETAPGISSLQKICDAYGITLSQLFAQEGEAVTLTDEQQELLRCFSCLSVEQQQALLQFLKTCG